MVNHPDIAILIQNAHDRVNAAEILYEREYYADAVSRAYYAMFYAARALLLSEEIIPRTHKGVISSISDRFVKTGRMEHEVWWYLAVGETLREEADYSPESTIDAYGSAKVIERAKLFIQVCETLLRE